MEARTKIKTNWELKILESLLQKQQEYPQLTRRLWGVFEKYIIKRKIK